MARKPSKTPGPAAPATSTGPSTAAGDGSTSSAGNAVGGASRAALATSVQATTDATPSTPPALDPIVIGGDTVPARILRDCWLGAAGEIIELDAANAQAVEASGAVDLHALALVDHESDDDAPVNVVIEADED